MKGIRVGYTQGVFDMFHIGHLNLLKQAKENCDYLIVGVNSDNLVLTYKKKKPVVPERERMAILEAIKYVDEVFIVDTLDKMDIYKCHPFNVVFIGNDWKGHPRWIQTERDLDSVGVIVEYLKYTQRVCSSELRGVIDDRVKDRNENID